MSKAIHEIAQLRVTTECCVVCQGKVLVQLRSLDSDFFPGYLTFPGGHVDQGEDLVTSTIREVFEETGVKITETAVRLRVSAINHHLDTKKIWCAFGFFCELNTLPEIKASNEGSVMWVAKEVLLQSDKVFPPIAYYLKHLFSSDKVLYMSSECEDGLIIKVTSEIFV